MSLFSQARFLNRIPLVFPFVRVAALNADFSTSSSQRCSNHHGGNHDEFTANAAKKREDKKRRQTEDDEVRENTKM